jgi:hypothetical protein
MLHSLKPVTTEGQTKGRTKGRSDGPTNRLTLPGKELLSQLCLNMCANLNVDII